MPPFILSRFVNKADLIWLLSAFVLYSVLRYPMLVHAAGQQDEQFYSVPGLIVLQEGIPRIPFCGTRERRSFFKDADRCLFTLPPALHYVQAPFFAIFSPGNPTARLPSFLGGFLLLILVWRIARFANISSPVAGLAICMLAVSRPMMFDATMARPDLLCSVCGLGTIHALQHWSRSQRHRMLIVSGALVGLGGLFHPFAVVFGIQGIFWTFLKAGGWKFRLQRTAIFSLAALAVFSCWLPLIIAYPSGFDDQFANSVLNRSGPGFVHRMLWPWQSLSVQAFFQWEFNGPYQMIFLLTGMVIGAIYGFRKGTGIEQTQFVIIVLTSVYLLATATGTHPAKGYWLYPIALLYPLAVVGFSELCSQWIPIAFRTNTMIRSIAIGLLLVLMIPGSGIRTTSKYLMYWGDKRYHAGNFIASVLEDLPREGVFISDVSFVFDVYLSGRETLLCQPKVFFWGEQEIAFDYLLVNNEGTQYSWPEEYGSVFEKRFGDCSEPQECFVDVYVPRLKQSKAKSE